MGILLSGISAWEYWCYAAHARCMPRPSARCAREQSYGKPSAKEVHALGECFPFLSAPLHLLAPNPRLRCRCKGVMSHVEPSKLGQQGVYRIGEGRYVVSPAEVFLQLATVLPFPNLLEVGFELCGRYARPIGGYLELGRRDPLASAAGLDRFLERMASVPGASTARRAVCFILDGSWSPMETSSVLYLCLPFRLGGYGLPAPLMNAVVPVPDKDRAHVGKSFYRCDLYWPEARFAIEYDSNLHHTGAGRIAQDASRRTDLAYLGVEVATLTQGQVRDRRELDRIALLLAKRLGKRLRMERVNPSGAQDYLRTCLLDSARKGA